MPPKNPKPRIERTLNIRIPPGWKTRMARVAREQGMNLSAYIRAVLDADADQWEALRARATQLRQEIYQPKGKAASNHAPSQQ